jgi:hypothetical protein
VRVEGLEEQRGDGSCESLEQYVIKNCHIFGRRKRTARFRATCTFNDYWLAAIDTYKYALSLLSLDHAFQKILIIAGDGSVEHLCGK